MPVRALEPDDPRSLGRCRILARIGAGGMGMIYFGRSGSGRPVALKVVHAEFARDPEYRERFHREVAATRAVGGRYSPGVLDADPDAARPWLATEFLPSVSLREAVELVGPLPADLVRPLAAGIVEALASVHDAGIVHLDVKPGNILLTAEGPRLIDFGIAVDRRPGVGPPKGEPAGTRGFMAPEQSSGGPVGPASDVFAFGATLAYACTGASQGPDGIADERLRAVIEGCLRADPAARPTVPELASMTSGGPPVAWPPSVTARLAHRAGEAANPPVAVPPPPARGPEPVRPVRRRRALALAGGVLALAGAAVVFPMLLLDDRPGTAATPGGTAGSAGSVAPSPPPSSATTRALEFYVFGTSTLKSLTMTVNGESVTVRDRRLPYRRVVRIPPETQRTTWRLDYRFGEGTFSIAVSVDGRERGSAGGSSRGPDVARSIDGAV